MQFFLRPWRLFHLRIPPLHLYVHTQAALFSISLLPLLTIQYNFLPSQVLFLLSVCLSPNIYWSLALHFSSHSLSTQQPLHLACYISRTLGSNSLLIRFFRGMGLSHSYSVCLPFSLLEFLTDCLFGPTFSFSDWSLISQSFHLLGICFIFSLFLILITNSNLITSILNNLLFYELTTSYSSLDHGLGTAVNRILYHFTPISIILTIVFSFYITEASHYSV